MGNMTPEGKVRQPVLDWAKNNGIGHVRQSFRPGVKQGVPDDLFLVPGGIAVFIEFKRLGKEPTPLQFARLEMLQKLGFVALWADTSEAGIAALQFAKSAAASIELVP